MFVRWVMERSTDEVSSIVKFICLWGIGLSNNCVFPWKDGSVFLSTFSYSYDFDTSRLKWFDFSYQMIVHGCLVQFQRHSSSKLHFFSKYTDDWGQLSQTICLDERWAAVKISSHPTNWGDWVQMKKDMITKTQFFLLKKLWSLAFFFVGL